MPEDGRMLSTVICGAPSSQHTIYIREISELGNENNSISNVKNAVLLIFFTFNFAFNGTQCEGIILNHIH